MRLFTLALPMAAALVRRHRHCGKADEADDRVHRQPGVRLDTVPGRYPPAAAELGFVRLPARLELSHYSAQSRRTDDLAAVAVDPEACPFAQITAIWQLHARGRIVCCHDGRWRWREEVED